MATALRMTEADLQRAIIDAAELHGWRVFHVADVRRQLRSHTSVGYPDLTLVHPRAARLAFIELKSDRGTLSDEQAAWMAALELSASCDVFLWRPSDLGKAITYLADAAA